jgi:serine/threonine protein kinase
MCFVTELCSGGDLYSFIKKRRKLTETHAKYFFV